MMVLGCGCQRQERPGHVHTKLCEQHAREAFAPRGQKPAPKDPNLDLIGG